MGKKLNTAIISASVACLIVTSAATMPTFAAETLNSYDRNGMGGNDRVNTAIKIAEASWNGAWKDGKTAVLASGNDANLVDALAVAPLAYEKRAPILLSRNSKDAVDDETLKEIKIRKVQTVYLAAGTGVLSEKIEAQLKDAGVRDIIRLGGSNRYETAKNIAKELGSYSKVAVVNGEVGLADALSIASIAANQGMAIALSDGKNVPVGFDLNSKTVYAVGGTGVLPEGLVNGMKATRLGGKNNAEINAAVINQFKAYCKFDNVYIANGAKDYFADSLTASVLAAQTASPIFVVDNKLDPKQEEVLKANVSKATKVSVLDGNVDAAVASTITKMVNETSSAVNTKPDDKVVTSSEKSSSKDESDTQKPPIQDTIPSTLTKISATDTNTFVLEFSDRVDSESVRNVNNFRADKNIKVVNTSLDITGTKVTLTTDAALANTIYTLTIENIKNTAGKTMEKIQRTITAVEDRTSPEVVSIQVDGPSIYIEFNDEHGMDKAALENKDNYSINGCVVKEVKAYDEDEDSLYERLVITTDKLEENRTYALTMNNLTDGSVLKNPLRKVGYEFNVDCTPPTVVSVSPNSTTSSAIVVLSEKLNVELDENGKRNIANAFKVIDTDNSGLATISKAEYDDANTTIIFTLSGVTNTDVLTTDNTINLTDLAGNLLTGDIAIAVDGRFVKQ